MTKDIWLTLLDGVYKLTLIIILSITFAYVVTSKETEIHAQIRDSQEQLITAMKLGEPECDAWQTSEDTVVRCMWHSTHGISIMSCPDGRLIPEKYRNNGNILEFCK